jgi:hypothetical protein
MYNQAFQQQQQAAYNNMVKKYESMGFLTAHIHQAIAQSKGDEGRILDYLFSLK